MSQGLQCGLQSPLTGRYWGWISAPCWCVPPPGAGWAQAHGVKRRARDPHIHISCSAHSRQPGQGDTPPPPPPQCGNPKAGGWHSSETHRSYLKHTEHPPSSPPPPPQAGYFNKNFLSVGLLPAEKPSKPTEPPPEKYLTPTTTPPPRPHPAIPHEWGRAGRSHA